MTLTALEPIHDAISAWAAKRAVPVHEGLIELNDTVPQVTVVGFALDDVQLFLTLISGLQDLVLVLDSHRFDDESLRLAQGLVAGLQDPKDRRYYSGLIDAAKPHLGQLQQLTAYAFTRDLDRAVIFRSTSDWGAPLYDLVGQLEKE